MDKASAREVKARESRERERRDIRSSMAKKRGERGLSEERQVRHVETR